MKTPKHPNPARPSSPVMKPRAESGIMAFRKGRGMSQSDLAKKIGVRQATISDWETGRKEPSRLAILALAHIGYGNEKKH